MATPVIARAYRTPQGKEGGAYEGMRAEDLSKTLIDHTLSQTGLSAAHVDDLRWGCAQQRHEQDNNLARVIALLSDLGESVPATTINRWCASSMSALASAGNAIVADTQECIIAGGVEHMTSIPLGGAYSYLHEDFTAQYELNDVRMGATAEAVADRYSVSRQAQDEYALRSHRRAAKATDTGRFEEELVPIKTDSHLVTEDEGIRRDTSLEKLQRLDPVFAEGGTVTPGNASQVSDGAALLLVTSRSFADDYGLDVLAEVGTSHVAGVDPEVMGIGPIPATRGLLEKTDSEIDEFGLVELNEAFASQCIYCKRELGVEDEVFNVNGGAISLGHPLGASGARLPVTLLHEMDKRDVERGLASLCVGFGQGMAIEFAR